MAGKKSSSKKWLIGIVAAVLLLAVAAAVTAYVVWDKNDFVLELSMSGDAEITLEYGESYTEPGARAVFYGTILMKDATALEVTTRGTVDTAKVGEYEIEYRVRHTVESIFGDKTMEDSCTRTVRIVDTQAPVITLTSVEGYYTLPGQTYEEEGYTASDNYDGDLTDQVERIVSRDQVTYKVTDSSGNSAEVSRDIFYDDPVAPEITLLGESEITVEELSSFEDPGCTAQDNLDGDLTGLVTVTGEVDMYTPGTYELHYSVADAHGNTATVTRTVTVTPKPLPANPVGGIIYLTFDDGPGKYTSQLLDILAKYNVKVTFFVVRTGDMSILGRMAAEGHTVAMHTLTHNFDAVYASEEAYFNDLYAIQSIITEQTGQTPMLLRFPGGSSNTISRFNPGIMTRLTAEVEARGFRYFDWNVDSQDAGGAKTSSEVFYNVVYGVANRSSSVVLQHDTYGISVAAVERIIQWGLANGYTFLPLDMNSPGFHHTVRN